MKAYPDVDGDFAFYNAPVFKREDFFDQLDCYELQHNFRHSDDPHYSEQLSKVRLGKQNADVLSYFNSRVITPPERVYFLTVSNKNANIYNNKKLAQLEDKYPARSVPSIQYFIPREFPSFIQLRMTATNVGLTGTPQGQRIKKPLIREI